MLRLRIATALVLGSIVIAVLLSGNNLYFLLFLSVCMLAGSWEWSRLCTCRSVVLRMLYTVCMTSGLLLLLVAGPASLAYWVVLTGVVWWCLALVMILCYQAGIQDIFFSNQLKYLMGVLVLIPSFTSLYYLYDYEQGHVLVLVLFLLIWLADSAAYFAGKAYGSIRLAERVSPGKTVEGFIAGMVAAAGMAVLYGYQEHASINHILLLAILFLLTTLFSVVGDLFESMMKRECNLKDSSHLLPGHGGVLDRIDSLTAASPVFVLGILLIEGRA